MTAKAPYRVPTMQEIAAIEPNGYNVISTFAGGGGSSLGYRMAGYRVLWANEFIESARETYSANKANYTTVDGRDIREVTATEILETVGINKGDLDILDGSPPCASFSTAGKRHKGWGKVKRYSDGSQRTDDLFFEYARLVEGLRPKVFVAENVSGLVKGSAKGYFLEILDDLKSKGYRVSAKLLDAQWLGVPQARQRLIFVGVRNDLGLPPVHPKPSSHRYSIRDAFIGLEEQEIDHITSISKYAIGRYWDELKGPGYQQHPKRFNLIKPDYDKPCPTILATGGNVGAAGVTHPKEKRKFTIAELKRICSFPDDYKPLGNYTQQWERMGRAVPPMMMRSIAQSVRTEILDKIK